MTNHAQKSIPIVEFKYSLKILCSVSVPGNHKCMHLAACDTLSNSHLLMNLASIASDVSVCNHRKVGGLTYDFILTYDGI